MTHLTTTGSSCPPQRRKPRLGSGILHSLHDTIHRVCSPHTMECACRDVSSKHTEAVLRESWKHIAWREWFRGLKQLILSDSLLLWEKSLLPPSSSSSSSHHHLCTRLTV